IESLAKGRRRWIRPAVLAATIIGGLVFAPYAKPLLPVETFIRYQRALHLEPPRTENQRLGKLPQQYADTFGWQEIADAVAAAYRSLPPEERGKCALYGLDYGEAGAIDFFGRQFNLPPAISGHQNYFFWGPRGYTGECMII